MIKKFDGDYDVLARGGVQTVSVHRGVLKRY
jgi:hypothetical protein